MSAQNCEAVRSLGRADRPADWVCR